MEKALEFIKAIGVPESVIKQIQDSTADTDITALLPETETHFSNYYKEKLKDEIHKAGKGAAYSEAITAIRKKAGLTTQEIEGKKFEEVVELMNERIIEKAGNKGAVEELNRLKQELIDAQNEKKKYDEEIIPSLKAEKESAITEYKKRQVIMSEVNKHKLVGASNYIIPGFTADLLSKYKVEFDANDNPIITDINGAKVYDDKKKELSLSEIIINEGKASNIFAVSNAGEGQQQQQQQQQQQANPNVKAGSQAEQRMQKAKERIAEQRTLAGIK